MIGEVRRSASELSASREEIPKHFANADDFEFQRDFAPETGVGTLSEAAATGRIPNRCSICSRVPPLVSGMTLRTQSSWRNIITAKKAKAVPPEACAMMGKVQETAAAMNQ